jgi:hypothetical protein
VEQSRAEQAASPTADTSPSIDAIERIKKLSRLSQKINVIESFHPVIERAKEAVTTAIDFADDTVTQVLNDPESVDLLTTAASCALAAGLCSLCVCCGCMLAPSRSQPQRARRRTKGAGSDGHHDSPAGPLPVSVRQAAVHGNAAAVSKFLSSSTGHPDAFDDGRCTSLHHASNNGHSDIVRVLINAGADVNVADQTGRTALHLAARGGHGAIVKLLLDTGAEPACADIHGHTPHEVAEQSKNAGCALLIQRRLNANRSTAAAGTAGAGGLTLRARGSEVDDRV